ncbi:DNA-binding transcriptional regulator YiaG [Natronocella acetinitrilica]|uniref:DNA-binding transcriptional regulator YiaG n=1 Tax=Natronocella acetinitrilica TaxID=414046 RepID=A0AAE3KC19_9GAMM|nr:hypothetical protein [Natronocella acetinitrilica]MCP1674403.1 DNA-binding transcriptional regulator YiaG [Natronocella acetinitrilica]
MTPEALSQWRQRLKPERGKVASKAQAARALLVPVRTYEDWEAGRRRIPGPVALACSAVLWGLPPFAGQ